MGSERGQTKMEYPSLKRALWMFPNKRCSDPRDIAYSLPNICSFEKERLVADYTKFLDDVFLDIKSTILEDNCLFPRISVSIDEHPQGPNLEMPSWVIYFRKEGVEELRSLYQVTGTTESIVEI